jgi:hypothetical protein
VSEEIRGKQAIGDRMEHSAHDYEEQTIRLRIPPQGVISQSMGVSVRVGGRRCGQRWWKRAESHQNRLRGGLVARRKSGLGRCGWRYIHIYLIKPRSTYVYSVVLVARNASIYRLPRRRGAQARSPRVWSSTVLVRYSNLLSSQTALLPIVCVSTAPRRRSPSCPLA